MEGEESRRPGVFVSYSRRDKKLLERLHVSLQVLERAGHSVWWSDQRLKPGEKWGVVILERINAAAAALLVLSQDFFASEFINEVELPAILHANKTRGMAVLPIVLKPIDLSMHSNLEGFQAFNDPAKPLVRMSDVEREAFWVEVVGWIRKTFSRLARPPSQPELLSDLPGLPPRDRFFTGREDVLEQLRLVLTTRRRVSLCGMPGVGKTRTALEYAYLHRNEYRHIFWVNAATPESLTSGYSSLASALKLTRQDSPYPNRVAKTVLERLKTEPDWLLILDNADELPAVQALIPADGSGHLMLTTREPATRGLQIEPLKMEKMPVDDGARLILRRAGLLGEAACLDNAKPFHREAARAISREVDGLPLALYQAGAVIEEKSMSPDDYLNGFRVKAGLLLPQRGILGGTDHASVTVTFQIAFDKLCRASPAAADLLRLCAFLAPEAIPEEILTMGASDLDALLVRPLLTRWPITT